MITGVPLDATSSISKIFHLLNEHMNLAFSLMLSKKLTSNTLTYMLFRVHTWELENRSSIPRSLYCYFNSQVKDGLKTRKDVMETCLEVQTTVI